MAAAIAACQHSGDGGPESSQLQRVPQVEGRVRWTRDGVSRESCGAARRGGGPPTCQVPATGTKPVQPQVPTASRTPLPPGYFCPPVNPGNGDATAAARGRGGGAPAAASGRSGGGARPTSPAAAACPSSEDDTRAPPAPLDDAAGARGIACGDAPGVARCCCDAGGRGGGGAPCGRGGGGGIGGCGSGGGFSASAAIPPSASLRRKRSASTITAGRIRRTITAAERDAMSRGRTQCFTWSAAYPPASSTVTAPARPGRERRAKQTQGE